MEIGGVANVFVCGPTAGWTKKQILMVERRQYLRVMRVSTTYGPSRLLAPLRKRLWQPIELHEALGL